MTEVAPKEPARRALALGFALAAAGLIGLLVIRSVTRPYLPFDAWSYHLPFAARLFGIGGGGDGFVLGPWNQQLFDGFPLAAEWLQGALWWISGSPRFVTAINSLSLVGLIVYAATSLRLPLAPLVFGMLAVPMVTIHAASGLIDLFVAATLGLQALAAIRCLELGREPRSSDSPTRWRRHALLFVVAAILAGNSKYMGMAVSWVLSAFLLAHSFSTSLPPRRRRALAVTAIVAGLLAGGYFWRNWIVFGSGIYPAAPDRLTSDLWPSAPVRKMNPLQSYTLGLGPLRRPAEFVLSATEIDWWIRGVERRYNVDSNNGDKPRRFHRTRTGGWWGAYVLALLLSLGAALRRRRTSARSLRERLLVRQFGIVTLAIAALPFSGVLRYWMIWPLLLVVLCTQLHASRARSTRALLFTAGVALAFLASYFVLPTTADLKILPAYRFDLRAMRTWVDPDLLRAADAGESFCLGDEHYPMQFRYSRAFVGGRHSIEQVETRGNCVLFPRLDVRAPAIRRPRVDAGR